MSKVSQALSDLRQRALPLLQRVSGIRTLLLQKKWSRREQIIAAIAVTLLALSVAGGLWWRAQNKAAHKPAAVVSKAPAKPIAAPGAVSEPVAVSAPVVAAEPVAVSAPVAEHKVLAKAEPVISPPQGWQDVEAHASSRERKLSVSTAPASSHKKKISDAPFSGGSREREHGSKKLTSVPPPEHKETHHALPHAVPVENTVVADADAIPAADMPQETQGKSVPQQADKEFRRGSGLMQQGRTDEALAAFKSALRIDPGFDAARQTMVGLLLTSGRKAEAERVLQDALKMNPRHSSFAKQLARLQVERDAPWEALVTLQKTLPNAEPVAEAKQGSKSASAVGVDKRVRQITVQQQAENEMRKAAELMRQGQVNEALAGYEAALQLDATLDTARQAMIGLLLENKRNSEAERVLREGLKSNPKRSDYAMLLARLMVERDASWSALLVLQKSLPYAERQADYQAFLAALLQRMNHHQEAVNHYKVAVQLAPSSGLWLMGMGISLQAIQHNDEARDAYRHALESRSLSADMQAFVAQRMKEL